MRNSIELYIMELTVWVGCIAFLGWVSYGILRKIIIDDLKSSPSLSNHLHRYSSVIAIVSAAIFTILFYRLSNKFFIEQLSATASSSMIVYILVLFLGFSLGYLWVGFAAKRYHELNDYDFLSDEDFEQKQYHSKNIFVFTLSFSFFALLMSSPSMIERDIPVIRELFLTIFFGSSVRMLFSNTNNKKSFSSILSDFFS